MTPIQALDDKILSALKDAISGYGVKSARDTRLNLAVRKQRQATDAANASIDALSRLALPGLKFGEVLALPGWAIGFQNVASSRLSPVRIVAAEEIADRIAQGVDEAKAQEQATAQAQEEDPAQLFEPRPDPQAPTPPAAPKMHPADSPEPFTPYEVQALRKFLHSANEAEMNGFRLISLTPRHAELLNRLLVNQANAKPNNVA